MLEEGPEDLENIEMQTNDFDEVLVQSPRNEVYFEFYLAMPTLEELASFAIAVELWRAEVKQKDPSSKLIVPEDWDLHNKPTNDEEIREKLRKDLPTWVPSKILEIIRSCLQVVKCEMYRWTTYYCQIVAIKDITFCDLMFCIWLPNGLIDEHNTALNMLSNPSRSLRDKFKIMCIFCLEDEIRKLSTDSMPEHCYTEMAFPYHIIVNYWISFMKRLHALSASVPNVEKEFWGRDWQPPAELLTWIRLGYEYDNVRYATLLEVFSKVSAYRVKQIEYIIELWKCSTDRSKSRARRAFSLREEVFKMHMKCERKTYKKPSSKHFDFLWAFLSSGSNRFKRNFLFEQQLSIVFMDFSTIDRLFEICLPNASDFVEYKRFLTNPNNAEGRHDEVFIKLHVNAFEAVARFLERYFHDQSERDRLHFINKFISAFLFESNAEVNSVQSYLEAIRLVQESNEVQPYVFHS